MTPRRVRLDVDMRIHAALADEAQVSKAFKQRGGNRCPFTNQDQRFSLSQSFREHLDIVDMIVPDGYVVPIELVEALQRPKGVEIVIQDGDLHLLTPPLRCVTRTIL